MYDALVVGAGPGGSTAAILMARAGLKVALLDKASFPRDKICGDALSGKTVDVLRRLGIAEQLAQDGVTHSWGVTFGGPYGDQVSIPFDPEKAGPIPPGFVVAREQFDNLLVQAAVREGVTLMEGTGVTGLLFHRDSVQGVRVEPSNAPPGEIVAPLTIGADGAYSVVARSLGFNQLDERHYSAGLRAYYEGVSNFHPDNFIELHFVEQAAPGYFWIFPMGGGRANVGVGMLSSVAKKRKVRLKALMESMIAHPRFRDRFRGARRIGNIAGWGLPLGSQPRTMAGNGWMLVGDAASLIDPFTGEGIGNAMVSGATAADWAAKATAMGDYSLQFLHGYERQVLATLSNELRISHQMIRLASWKWLLNLVIKKASRSPELSYLISCMFHDEKIRKKLLSPAFYLRLLMT